MPRDVDATGMSGEHREPWYAARPMATVTYRVGWGRGSRAGLALSAVFFLASVPLYLTDRPILSLWLVGFGALPLGFALVHPHRVVTLDDDDDPSRRVGDMADD